MTDDDGREVNPYDSPQVPCRREWEDVPPMDVEWTTFEVVVHALVFMTLAAVWAFGGWCAWELYWRSRPWAWVVEAAVVVSLLGPTTYYAWRSRP